MFERVLDIPLHKFSLVVLVIKNETSKVCYKETKKNCNEHVFVPENSC